MKKGFTLIELLAVIVILAIIALIATPIILGIINNAKKESQERSVELYASAVRNGIASYQLTTGNAVAAGTYNKTNKLPFEIETDGDVVCDTIEIYEDGSIYLADCTVNGNAVDYTYGEKQITQVYKPQYYGDLSFSGTVGRTDAPVESERLTVPPTGKNYYLGYDVTNGVVSAAYACFTRNGTEYCLKGTTDGSAYDANKTILEEAFGASACTFDADVSNCSVDGLSASADVGGVGVGGVSSGCIIRASSGGFACSG